MWIHLPSVDSTHLGMKHITVIIVLPANRKVHTVSPLLTKNIPIPEGKEPRGIREVSKGEELDFYLVIKYT